MVLSSLSSILLLFHLIYHQINGINTLSSSAYLERTIEKCTHNSRSNIELHCPDLHILAIHEAFATSSSSICPFDTQTSRPLRITKEELEIENSFPRLPDPCYDDLRLSLNKRCSGRKNCSFNLIENHASSCLDIRTIVVRYTCVPKSRYTPLCNKELTGNYGYVSTPGYPEFYVKCNWTVKGEAGQKIQIDILDAEIADPLKIVRNDKFGRTHVNFVCKKSFIIFENNFKKMNICGEDERNFVQFLSSESELKLEMKGEAFSPKRGVLFRYSMHNCPTIPPPKYGKIEYKANMAYASCEKGYFFQNTTSNEVILYCDLDNQWNSTFHDCIPEDISNNLDSFNSGTNAFVLNDSNNNEIGKASYVSDILIPIILMITLLFGNAVIVWVLLRLKRKHKMKKTIDKSGHLLNSGKSTDV